MHFHTASFVAVVSVLLLQACSDSPNSPATYTIEGYANGLETPITVQVGNKSQFEVTPHPVDVEITREDFDSGEITITQAESQTCIGNLGALNDETKTAELVIDCQSYRVGPSGVTDFAVSNDRTCAVVGNRVQCWGDNSHETLDLDNDYTNPRLVTLDYNNNLCFLDDTQLHCSEGVAFNPTEINAVASNIVEMLGFG